MRRAVLDTNVLIGALYNPSSASARIASACRAGRLTMVVSPALRDEYEAILPRAVRVPGWRGRFDELMGRAVVVHPAEVPIVVRGDPSDDMLFAAAVAGGAEAIVTNDRLLLQSGPYRGVRVVSPRWYAEELGEGDGE